MSVFETETMADLCVKQGFYSEGLAIYRRLVTEAPDAATRARRVGRVAELEARLGAASRRAAAAETPGAPGPETPTLTFERRGDAVAIAWSLPPETPSPALQLLLVRRGPAGIEAETRTVRLDATRGATTVSVAGLHSVRAAAGWLDGARFVPLIRLPPEGP